MESSELRLARSRLGQLIRGKYHLDDVLGVGGMGAVYAATHRNRKRFAVKMLHPEFSSVGDVRSRFLREGYVANTVGHPGAVAVLDDDVAEDGSAFLVMELLEGTSVEEFWEKAGRSLPCEVLLVIFDQVLDVLHAAHTQGVVHRDIKPANLFLTREGQLKVLDFGIARLRDATARGLTQTGAALGTPAFMPPEQALGKSLELDAQTDLWAVGATLFVLLTGRLVHEGDTAQELLVNSATRPAPSLRSIAPHTPAAVAELVDRALAFRKSERWGSAQEMQRALGRAHFELCGTDVRASVQDLAATVQRTLVLAPSRSLSAPSTPALPTSPPPRAEVAGGQSGGLAVAQVTGRRIPGVAAGRTSPSWLSWGGVAALLLGLGLTGFSLASRRADAPAALSGVASTVPQANLGRTSSAPSVSSSPSLVASMTAPARQNGPSRKGQSAVAPATVAPQPNAACARLLELQSLGEALTQTEQATFNRYCRRAP